MSIQIFCLFLDHIAFYLFFFHFTSQFQFSVLPLLPSPISLHSNPIYSLDGARSPLGLQQSLAYQEETEQSPSPCIKTEQGIPL